MLTELQRPVLKETDIFWHYQQNPFGGERFGEYVSLIIKE
jgi:hypothetical protein